ncbi:MAG: DUF402 domain-containing protein [Pyrinomonadaceae bacterium]|nr:DUF402 domain-containing protein [Pyrinomonadaceae bacterium]
MQGVNFTVNSRKFDGTVNRTWRCRPVDINGPALVLFGSFARDTEHPDLGSIAAGTLSYEFFWPGQWYNVFRFHEPDGSLRNFYYNVSMPYSLNGDQLDYIDLDIDLIVWPDGRSQVLDIEEFEQNTRFYNYPADVVSNAERTLRELIQAIESGTQPTDLLLTGYLPATGKRS